MSLFSKVSFLILKNTNEMVIYRNRQKGKNYHIEEVKSLLRQQMLLEEYDASVRGRQNEFLDIWERAYALIL